MREATKAYPGPGALCSSFRNVEAKLSDQPCLAAWLLGCWEYIGSRTHESRMNMWIKGSRDRQCIPTSALPAIQGVLGFLQDSPAISTSLSRMPLVIPVPDKLWSSDSLSPSTEKITQPEVHPSLRIPRRSPMYAVWCTFCPQQPGAGLRW